MSDDSDIGFGIHRANPQAEYERDSSDNHQNILS
jgi:hypothetical protein